MPKPIARTVGICFAFPDVLKTPTPSGDVPIPYPNIAQLSAADDASENVTAGGEAVIIASSSISSSSGGEAGVSGGTVESGAHLGACTFDEASDTVKVNGEGVVRQLDATKQNDGNATGMVMVGFPTVLVGD